MASCDICCKEVDERSLQVREIAGKTLYLCISCDGGYTDEELEEKIEMGEIIN